MRLPRLHITIRRHWPGRKRAPAFRWRWLNWLVHGLYKDAAYVERWYAQWDAWREAWDKHIHAPMRIANIVPKRSIPPGGEEGL